MAMHACATEIPCICMHACMRTGMNATPYSSTSPAQGPWRLGLRHRCPGAGQPCLLLKYNGGRWHRSPAATRWRRRRRRRRRRRLRQNVKRRRRQKRGHRYHALAHGTGSGAAGAVRIARGVRRCFRRPTCGCGWWSASSAVRLGCASTSLLCWLQFHNGDRNILAAVASFRKLRQRLEKVGARIVCSQIHRAQWIPGAEVNQFHFHVPPERTLAQHAVV
eukprot:SAG22_NODE_2907_length_2113_cov_2.397219_1_plen_220_part_00